MTPQEIAKLPYRPCVGVMVLNSDGLIWAGRRIDNTDEAWQMPQGGIDNGEAPRDAALRELTEETSIPASHVQVIGEMDEWLPYELPIALVPQLWNGRFRGQTQKWFAMRFEGPDSLIDIATEEPEFSHWAWMSREDLINKIVPFKLNTYQAVFESFSQSLGGMRC